MHIWLPGWGIAVVVTVLLWVAVIAWPIEGSRGDYAFGAAFDAMAHLVVGVIATLVIWLLYFIVT